MRRRHNPYAESLPSDWSSWSPRQQSSWRRRNWIAREGMKPRSQAQRIAAMRARMNPGRRRNPRYAFLDGEEVKLRARTENRRRKTLTDEQKRATTGRLPAVKFFAMARSNPGQQRKYRRGARPNLSSADHRSRIRSTRKGLRAWRMMDQHKTGRRAKKWATSRDRWAERIDHRGNPRMPFISMADVKARRRGAPMAYPVRRSNPFTLNEVGQVARQLKSQYGGQAYGWAEDAEFACKSGSSNQRMWHEVAKRLKAELYRSNPKRDGTPTRGEKRQGKYKDHLRTIRERGVKAQQELNRLLGRGHAGAPALAAEKTETQLAHPGHYAAEMTSDQKFAQEQISRLEATMADLRTQLRDIGDRDDADELADELSGQIAKLGGQKKALMQISGLAEAPVKSNPGRRQSRGHGRSRARHDGWGPLAKSQARYASRRSGMKRRFNPGHKVAYRRALTHYGQALQQLHYALHRM